MITREEIFHLPVDTREMYGTFSPDRTRLMTGGDGTEPKVHIWDVETGNRLHTLYRHTEPVAALAWANDQQWIASAALIEAFGFGMPFQANASLFWRVIGCTSGDSE